MESFRALNALCSWVGIQNLDKRVRWRDKYIDWEMDARKYRLNLIIVENRGKDIQNNF